MQIKSPTEQVRFLRILSRILSPISFVEGYFFVLAPFLVGSVTAFFSLVTVPIFSPWFPVESVRLAVLGIFGLSIGLLTALPAYKEKQIQDELRALIIHEYSKYVVSVLQGSLDSQVGRLQTTCTLSGSITMSIMIPFGNEIFVRARRLKIMVASTSLRPLPTSMNLNLDWDEGVAGHIWKEGVGATPLAVKNNPEFFQQNKINRISPLKRSSGNFGHKVGVCIPIISYSLKANQGKFMGVLNIGTDDEKDYEVLSSRKFSQEMFHYIEKELLEGVRLLSVVDK